MKKIMFTLLMAASVAASAQAFPFDFESTTAGPQIGRAHV